MTALRLFARHETQPSIALVRFATTEAVKRPRKNAAAPPTPKLKAMKTPNNSAVTAYRLFIQKFAEEQKNAGEKWLLQNAADAYKKLPDSEKAKLVEQIPELIAQRKAIYEEFVSKLSPSEILAENQKRTALRKERIAAGKSVKNLAPILDKNAPTRPGGPYILWSKEARQAPEFKDQTLTEQAKALGEKWKALAENEKAEWNEKAKQLRSEYEQKKSEYYGSS